MLQIKDISKQYKTGSLVQRALDHVSLNLRDNEFVAILGPSGSGKTTLLNIIGGLDRYDSGDLIINGVSTKKYKDKDWDSYRNHTIGFVFQSYNLIPHQSILSNVELALTISGISRSERKKRAAEALEKVGLGDQLHKKPNQMSGGQMQRVAIARALVNDPDILLADEPTGALDSETSLQVMDLLKEVARDRLVVMVTHNPELAEQYATRIVNLKDGTIRADSDPYIVDDSDEPPVHRNMGRSSMSFLTALLLSFNNLRSKSGRTILVAVAGSIGIIGIALILSLSNGVNAYIRSIEEETLSEYPLQIQSSSFDLASFMMLNASPTSSSNDEEPDENAPKKVRERMMVNGMLSRTTSNDLASLKKFLDSNEEIRKYTNAIEYSYSISPLIYRLDGDDSYRQINPDTSFSKLGFGGSTNSLMSLAMSTDSFYCLPQEDSLYKHQYDIKAGRWPEKYNECVLVLFSSGSIPDITLYTLGLKDSAELDEIIDTFAKEENYTKDLVRTEWDYEDFIGLTYKAVNNSDLYSYDSEYNVWVDKTDDKAYMLDLLRGSEDITIVGVVQASEDADIAMLQVGVGYPFELVEHMVGLTSGSRITQSQLGNKYVNVFTGHEFGSEEDTGFNMDSLFTINENAFANAFKFDSTKLAFDTSAFSGLSNFNISDVVSPEDLSIDPSTLPDVDILSLLSELDIDVDSEKLAAAMNNIFADYLKYAADDPSTDYASLPDSFTKYLQDPDTSEVLRADIQQIVTDSGLNTISQDDLTAAVQHIMTGYPAFAIEHGYTDPDNLTEYLSEYLLSDEGSALTAEAIATLSEKYSYIEISDEDINKLVTDLSTGYDEYAKENSLPELSKFPESFEEYLNTDDGKKVVESEMAEVIDREDVEKQLNGLVSDVTSQYQEALSGAVNKMTNSIVSAITGEIVKAMQKSMGTLADSMSKAISIDTDAFANAFQFNMDEKALQELMAAMMESGSVSYESNLQKLGYADLLKPTVISIYPKDFDSKEEVVRILDEYNERMKTIDEAKVIQYTDTVGVLMSSVTTIVDTVSYVLIAFVAISLIVSSIMIGVITYISVLERRKEIGILRAIGASKRNISSVFNAETFIIGLLAGFFGVEFSRLILIPGNMLIHHLTDNPNVNAFLPVSAAVVLIVLSVILTLIGGIIPSKKAAKSDPVLALRTE